MRGEISVLARLSNNDKVSFKITKEQLKSIFSDFKLLNENSFLKLVNDNGLYIKTEVTSKKHNDNSSNKAFFAPFLLGMFFVDFKNKKVFAYNDLEPIFKLDSWFIRNEYLFLLSHAKKNNAGDIIRYLKPSSSNLSSYHLPYRIKTAIDNDALIIARGRAVSYELGDDESVYTVLNNISNENLSDKNLDDIIELRKRQINNNEGNGTGYEDVVINIPGWELNEGYSDEINSVLKYCKQEKILTLEEEDYWEGFIKASDMTI